MSYKGHNGEEMQDYALLDTLRHKSRLQEQDRGAMSWHRRSMHLSDPDPKQSRGKTRGQNVRSSKHREEHSSEESNSDADNIRLSEAMKAEERIRGFGHADELDPAILDVAIQAANEKAMLLQTQAKSRELSQDMALFVDLLIAKHKELASIDAATSTFVHLADNSVLCKYKCMLAVLISYLLFVISHASSGLSTQHPVFSRITDIKEQLNAMQPRMFKVLKRIQLLTHAQAKVRAGAKDGPVLKAADDSVGSTQNSEEESSQEPGGTDGDDYEYDEESGAEGGEEDLVVFNSDSSEESSACELESLDRRDTARDFRQYFAIQDGIGALKQLEMDINRSDPPVSGDRSVSAYEQRIQRMQERREAQRLRDLQADEKRRISQAAEKTDSGDELHHRIANTVLKSQEANKDIHKAFKQNQKSYDPTYYDPTEDKIDPSDRVGHRPVSFNMKKGLGDLRRHKRKHGTTSRTMLRYKYDKAVAINQRTAVPTREQDGAYTGEVKGIRTNVTHSKRLG